jgi:hypothetical protein
MGRYVTAAQMAAILGLDGSTSLDALDFFIHSAEAAVDRETGRSFDAVTETRQFDVSEPGQYLNTGDLVSVTAVGVADATGEAFTTLAVTDYFLGPVMKPAGYPYRWLALSNLGSWSYAFGYRTVEITGTWGWAAVPYDIQSCVMTIVSRSYQQGRAGGISRITDIPGLGTVEFSESGGVGSSQTAASLGGLTASEARTLARYRRVVVA